MSSKYFSLRKCTFGIKTQLFFPFLKKSNLQMAKLKFQYMTIPNLRDSGTSAHLTSAQVIVKLHYTFVIEQNIK